MDSLVDNLSNLRLKHIVKPKITPNDKVKVFAKSYFDAGVGKVSQFSLFHGNPKQKKLDTAKITEHFMRKVSNSYIDNMKTLLKDNLDKEDVNLDIYSVNEINGENNSHQNETEAVDEEASNVKEHDKQNDIDIMAETYGDNMEFFETKTMLNEAFQHVINQRELFSRNFNNSLTMSTYDSNLLLELEENEIDDEIDQLKNKDNSRIPEENEIYVIYVKADDMSPEETPLLTEEALVETRMTPVHKQEEIGDSPYSYFDSFENEAFSSQHIAQHFNKIVQRPWQANYVWRR